MKRTGNLWPQICSEQSLMAGFQRAAIGKRSHRACFEFACNLGSNIHALLSELTDGTYVPRQLNCFCVRVG